MKLNLLLIPALLFSFFGQTNAQHRQCGSTEVLARQLLENPDLLDLRENIERQTRDFIQNGGAADRVVVTIPVVVHVVWKTTAQNISDAQIASQMTVLNNDFRKLNADASQVPAVWQGIAADCEVNFCMATQKDDGTATTGIERRQTTVTAFSTNDAMKFYAQGGLDAWNSSKYLNLWVCNMSGGILGYAQFPGGPANTDGVVVLHSAFGTTGTAAAPFNKGRTATHEVGHWLNCYHIWGDDGTSCSGSDLVSDTPNQADENYNCPTFPAVSCSNGPNGDMWMNYMDYVDDACMYMFSTGQKARMQALFASGGSRNSLTTSPGCQAPGGGSCGTPSGLAATGITQNSATLGWSAVSSATAYNLQHKTTAGTTWTTVSNLSGTSYNLAGLTAATAYDFKIQAICGATTGAYSSVSSFTTLPAGGCSDQFEPNNSRPTAYTNTPLNTAFTAQIASSADQDYYKFANTSSQKNIKLELTNLPADYDLKLWRSNTQMAVSENAGTANETIIRNNSTVSTSYYAHVYGYNGAFSNTQCYTLKVSRSSTAFRSDGSTDGPEEAFELDAVFENAGFGIFPNPANDEVTLEIPMTAEADVLLSLLDPSGKVVVRTTEPLDKTNNRVKLNIGTLAEGIYFVQVRTGETVKTRKLVVNK